MNCPLTRDLFETKLIQPVIKPAGAGFVVFDSLSSTKGRWHFTSYSEASIFAKKLLESNKSC